MGTHETVSAIGMKLAMRKNLEACASRLFA